MIRKSTLKIINPNQGKVNTLDILSTEMSRVINIYINDLWENQDFKSKFVTFKVDTWLSARLQQCLGKQALEIVKSQRKRKKKIKPLFTATTFNIDSRFVDFQYDNNTFDIWVRLSSLGNKIQLKLPTKRHKHYLKYKEWTKSKSIRLLKRHNDYFIECFFEKKQPEVKHQGNVIGVDCGYKKLLIDSNNSKYDVGLEEVYEKISRKKQNSNAFKRSLIERDNLINQSLNTIDLSNIKEVVCEDLKDVKKNSKGKIRKKFNNKLQRWSYSKVLNKLQNMTEEAGVILTKVNSAHTSQKCCKCGVICKSNRKGEIYKCACGNNIDADFNAAINLSHMGVYSPHVLY